MGRLEPDQKGIIPQMCEDLFDRIDKMKETENVLSTVEVWKFIIILLNIF